MEIYSGFPHFYICIFQDFLRSKLRFSRTVICSIKCCRGLNDHLSLQEKYSIIISNIFPNISKIFPGHFSAFPGLFQDFPRPGNLLIFVHFPGFQGFPGVWEPCYSKVGF